MAFNSDPELRTARNRLEARSAELRERVSRVRLDLQRAHQPLPNELSEAAVAVENDEILEAIEESALGELERIEKAISRIDAGRFSVCEVCGAHIPAARHDAVPYATQCERCAAR